MALRSPRQSSYTYSLDGVSPVRHKNLFYCIFTTVSQSLDRQKTLGFYVKSVERPQVTIDTEELNQYNKKRIINRGVKYSNITMTIYDTADNQALRFWDTYAKQYFGDFRHERNIANFNHDVVSETFANDGGGGFGFAPVAVSSGSSNVNDQYVITKLAIYELFEGQFTRFDLINPKITSFAPDSLDYSETAASTITFQFAYEAVIYANSGSPQSISADSLLSAAIEQFGLKGNTIEPATTPTRTSFGYPQPPESIVNFSPYPYPVGINPLTQQGAPLAQGGLGAYGAYNFGSLGGNRNTASDIATIAALATGVASALAISAATTSERSSVLSAPYTSRGSLDHRHVEVVQSNLGRDGSLGRAIVGGAIAASSINGGSGMDRVNRSADGLSLGKDAIYAINSTRPPTAQIGCRDDLNND